jgi:hypothetical protein
VTQSFADAHAELPQTQFEAPNRNDAWSPVKPSETAIVENAQVSQVPDAATQQSIVASRWPEQFSTAVAVSPAKADQATSVEPVARPPSPPSPRATDQIATTEPSSQPPTYSAQLQLAALLGGLALAGIASGAVFNFGNSRSFRSRKTQNHPDGGWEPTDGNSIRAAHPGAHIPTRRSNFARDLNLARRNDRVAEFFSQLSKHTVT